MQLFPGTCAYCYMQCYPPLLVLHSSLESVSVEFVVSWRLPLLKITLTWNSLLETFCFGRNIHQPDCDWCKWPHDNHVTIMPSLLFSYCILFEYFADGLMYFLATFVKLHLSHTEKLRRERYYKITEKTSLQTPETIWTQLMSCGYRHYLLTAICVTCWLLSVLHIYCYLC